MFKRVIFLTVLGYVHSANILGLFPLSSGSHNILDFKLMKALADAGHNVTIISPTAQKSPAKTKGAITEIILEGFKADIEKMLVDINFFEVGNKNVISMMRILLQNMLGNANKTFYDPKVKELIASDQKFDALIIEQFQNDALKVFGNIFDCPTIILSSLGPNSWINSIIGNPNEISYIRHFHASGNPEKPMTFLERTQNLLYHILDYFLVYHLMLPAHDDILANALPEAPRMKDLYSNASLVLLNSHTSFYPPQPLVPNMIEIGGYHIDAPKKLPQDLQDFLDNAPDGVIYFSMGSNLKSKDIPEERKKLILNVLGKLKQKVIWKFEVHLPGKPDNILIRNWLPQQDILAHPNVKLFITHGGLLSTTETIYHGVPVLVIPVFGDQLSNAERAEYAGYGLKLGYHDKNFTESRISELIKELLTNPKYKKNAQRRSKLFHDRPMKPLETAVYWVEYVIRNHGARHLRVGAISQKWYEYYMLDVALVLLFPVLISTGVFVCIAKKVYRKIFSKKCLKQKQKIKTK